MILLENLLKFGMKHTEIFRFVVLISELANTHQYCMQQAGISGWADEFKINLNIKSEIKYS